MMRDQYRGKSFFFLLFISFILILTQSAQALELSVLAVDFGDVEIGRAGLATVTLTNPHSEPIQGIYVSDPGSPFVSSQPGVTELGFGESVDFSVGFEPTSEGTVNGTVVVNWGDDLLTTVNLKGNGVAAIP